VPRPHPDRPGRPSVLTTDPAVVYCSHAAAWSRACGREDPPQPSTWWAWAASASPDQSSFAYYWSTPSFPAFPCLGTARRRSSPRTGCTHPGGRSRACWSCTCCWGLRKSQGACCTAPSWPFPSQRTWGYGSGKCPSKACGWGHPACDARHSSRAYLRIGVGQLRLSRTANQTSRRWRVRDWCAACMADPRRTTRTHEAARWCW